MRSTEKKVDDTRKKQERKNLFKKYLHENERSHMRKGIEKIKIYRISVLSMHVIGVDKREKQKRFVTVAIAV